MRVVICDDAPLVREGIARLLGDFGFDVVGVAGDAAELYRQVAEEHPDAAIVDIRMPPTYTDEGIVAAQRIRSTSPATVVLVLSNHVEVRYAARLMGEMPDGLGYLLKERVANVGAIIDALERMRHGECVIDSTIIATLLSRRRPLGQLETLSAREYEVLQLMAEGLTNRGIAERLVVTERTVEGHVANVFSKLDLADDPTGNRRVLAVLRFLQRR